MNHKNQKISIIILTIIVSTVTSACRSRSQEKTKEIVVAESADTTAPAAEGELKSPEACPLFVEQVDIEVADTERGVAMTFTTRTSETAELRRRVRGLAALYEEQGGQVLDWFRLGQRVDAEMPYEEKAGIQPREWAGSATRPMPRVTTTVEDVERGARIELAPVASAQRDALRAHVRMQRERMNLRQCPVMKEERREEPTS